MKSFVILLLFTLCLSFVGCDNSQPATGAEAANSNQSGNNPVARVEEQAQAAAAAQQRADAAAKVKMPTFIDTVKGGIVDLPAYKNAQIYNMQYGPLNEADSAMVTYRTNDTVEQVAAYYNSVIKSHRWKILSNIREPDSIQITLAKGDRDEGLVSIKKNPDTQFTDILVSRAQKYEPKKPE